MKIDIVISTYNRRGLLQRMIEGIKERTKIPYRLIIVDNNSEADDTINYLEELRGSKEIDVLVLNDKNIGGAKALNEGFKYVRSELFITSDDDIVPPDLEPCWLEQLIELFKKYYPEYGAVALRNARMLNTSFGGEWLPHYPDNELGESLRSSCAFLRMQKRSDMEKMPNLFGGRKKYSSLYLYRIMKKAGLSF